MLRNKTSNWFECKIRYDKTMEDGMQKKVTELYVVDALTWGEAEKRISEEMKSFVSGDFEVSDIKIAPYKEVFFDECEDADKWYRVKVQFITIDERTEKEKRQKMTYLINAGSFDCASKNLSEIMKDTMMDYEKSNISETQIIDVYEYK